MSAFKPSHLTRAALTKAIESKVERMPLRDLVELASTLKVAVPAVAKAIRRREPKSASRPAPSEGRVLHGGGVGPVVSAAEGGRLLDAITVDDDQSDWTPLMSVPLIRLRERCTGCQDPPNKSPGGRPGVYLSALRVSRCSLMSPSVPPARLKYEWCTMFSGVALSVVASMSTRSSSSLVSV